MIGAYALMMVECRAPDNLMRIAMSRSFTPLGKVSMYRISVDFTANPTLACLDSLSGLPIQKKVHPAPFSISCDSPGSHVSLRAAMVMSYLATICLMASVAATTVMKSMSK